ncbi:MAG: ATP-dependent DNA ligase [Chitinophagaceae bacterium]
MKAFAELITTLGTSTKTNEKLELLSHYFATAGDADKVWVIALFSGRRPKRIVNSTLLKIWCREITNLPEWLFDEAYHTAGDLAESIALMLPEASKENTSNYSLAYIITQLTTIEKKEEALKKEYVTSNWMKMSKDEIFVFNKLLTGNFRIGVSQKMIVNALAKTVQLEPNIIAHRISGNWNPSVTSFDNLLSNEGDATDYSKPYPFYLAYAVDGNVNQLGKEEEWQAEWKWDGIRGQLIKRNDEIFVWSRGEELITDKFPEYHSFINVLPNGIVLDGEILPYTLKASPIGAGLVGAPLPFALLQTRIGRKNITKKNLQDVPISFFVYDILEYEGNDIRQQPLTVRRKLLEDIINQVNHPSILLSPVISFSSWDELIVLRMQSREKGAEGMMLKRKTSAYQVGRKTGDWWKWKIDPLVIDAVMIYAQKGHGRRSNLYTDYTFAVKDGEKLVSFAKAYSGLTDKEFAQVDYFVKNNSLEKFGPVRTVKPELVFEIAFEGIAESKRHKSGVALRFPRISRWRQDKKANEINTLEDLKKMLETYGK